MNKTAEQEEIATQAPSLTSVIGGTKIFSLVILWQVTLILIY